MFKSKHLFTICVLHSKNQLGEGRWETPLFFCVNT
nr:MAG TPA: hypothetical protein [Herelleviridae sp.]